MLNVLGWIGIALGGIVAIQFVLLILARLKGPKGLALAFRAPDSVRDGDEFEVVLEVGDTSGVEQALVSVNFDLTRLKGVEILSLDPEPTKAVTRIGDRAFEYTGHPIPANGALEIVVRCRAVAPGSYWGIVRIYVDHVDLRYLVKHFPFTVT